MNFEYHPHYDEASWRDDANARDLAELRREEAEMGDVEIESTPRSTGGVFVRADEYLCKDAWCDSSGMFEDRIDVDQTRAVLCPGCPNCEAERKTLMPIEVGEVAAPDEAEPKPIEEIPPAKRKVA
jgi:hypothetical protein